MWRRIIPCIFIATCVLAKTSTRPHIIFFLLDDVGHNDVGWNNAKIPTPFLNKLASEGVILDSYITYYFCTPSRAALLTGHYSDRLGLQRNVLSVTQPYGVPLHFKLISDRLSQVGYSAHAIGKWHVGYCNWKYTPIKRGFKSFLGFYNGDEENYKHCVDYLKNTTTGECVGFDFRKDNMVAHQYDGNYSTYVYTDYATHVIRSLKHKHEPLFLYIALTDSHFPLEAPRHYLNNCNNSVNTARKEMCGAMAAIDDSVKNVTQALKERGIYDNSVIIVASDNGGQPSFGGNNFPLRGEKGSIYQGGIRVPAFVHSPLLSRKGYINKQLIHVTDWHPTLLRVARAPHVSDLDGFDQWDTIALNKSSPRKSIPFQMDLYPNGSLTAGVMDHRYKLIAGSGGYHNNVIFESETVDKSFDAAFLQSYTDPYQPNFNLSDTALRLYDLEKDPSENNNLASEMPAKVKELQGLLKKYLQNTKPYMNIKVDSKGDPANFNNVVMPGWCETYDDTPDNKTTSE